MAPKLAPLLLTLVLYFCISEISARNVHHQLPVELAASTKDLKSFWFPLDDGSGDFVPAFLEGSPKDILADERDVKFYLFTSRNPNDRQQLFTDNLAALDGSNYNRNAPIKFVAHGFSGTSVGGSSGTIKDAYVRHTNVNVILIDWGPLAAAPWYDRAAANTRLVGQVTARFVEFLVDYNRASLSQITFIGHSLGAHVCGFIGSNLLVGRPEVIVGLDPALPLFGGVSNENRLDPSDAKFVQVVHTAGGSLLQGGLAFVEPIGDVDFYPNGGSNQPGCSGLPEVVGACSHSRAYEFYAESVERNYFSGCKCPAWEHFNSCDCGNKAHMGEHTLNNARGYYHLTTHGSKPYGQG